MKSVFRGTAGVVVLMVALTGCGGDGDAMPGSVGGMDQAPVALSAEQIRTALPTDTSLGNVFSGADAAVVQGDEARQYCTEESGTACDGLVAGGKKELEVRGTADDGGVEFTLFSFDSPEAASAVMKGMADQERKDATSPEAVQVEAGADETDAFASGSNTRVFMRVGGVVSYVLVKDAELDNVKQAASHQVDRIKNGV